MANENSIKFECCHCGQSIEAPAEMRGMEVKCPSCGKQVTVRGMISPAEVAELKKWVKEEKAQELRGLADNFSLVAKGILILYFIAATFTAIAATVGNVSDASWLLYVGGAAVGASAWCYLVAQIIYIRAALEKQRELPTK